MKDNESKTKGITLIALVITIIILIILSGITLSSLTGEKSVIKEARSAKEVAEMKSLEEQIEAAIIVAEQIYIEPTFEQVKKEIEKIETVTKVEDNGNIINTVGNPITGKLDNYLGGGGNPPEDEGVKVGEKVEGSNKEYTNGSYTAIIPVGFAIVPGCENISDGLVISDDEGDTELDSNNIIANGNQFVWIPVTEETEYKRNKQYTNGLAQEWNGIVADTGYLPSTITNEEEAVRNVNGFYISRYEAGQATTLVSKKNAKVLVNISQINTKSKAKTFIDNDYVKSALISGVQWDVAMGFISSKPRTDGYNNEYDVTKANKARHTGTVIQAAGINENDRVCNIYDLEGNANEYVAEKNTFYGKLIRRRRNL